jgi:membrane protease YdiL (CAAX protease family)
MQRNREPGATSFPSFGQAVLLVIGALGLQVSGGIIVSSFATLTGGGASPGVKAVLNPWTLSGVNLVSIGLILALGLRCLRESAGRFFSIKAFALTLVPAMVLTSLGLAVVLTETDNLFLELVRQIPGFDHVPLELFNLTEHSFGAFVFVVVVAPVTEEYLFRGMILRGLLARHRAFVAVAGTAVLFGAMHANLRQFFLGTVIGLVFGWWYVRTRSVGPCLIGHAVFNAVAWLAAQFPDELSVLGYNCGVQPIVHQPLWLTGGGAALAGLGLGWFKQHADPRPAAEPPLLAAASIPAPANPPPPLAQVPDSPAS